MVLERSLKAVKGKEDEDGARSEQAEEAAQPSGTQKKDDRPSACEKDSAKTHMADKEKQGAIRKIPVCSTPKQKTTVNQLREELGRLGLPTTGKKAELLDRLKQYEEDGEDDQDDQDEEVVTEGSGEEENDESLSESRENDSTEDEEKPQRNVIINDARDRRRSRTAVQRPVYNTASMFTIKDVEGSISHFSGDDKLSIERWIDEFEDMAALLQWNDLQKVIYAKKLLKGSAKQFVALQKGVTSWKSMRRRLLSEFETKLNSAIVHSQLSKRKRQSNETPRQYVYAMSTIANQGDVEEEAVMQYIIDGIQDDEAAKTILYSARTISELRKNLERYDQMKEKAGGKTHREHVRNKSKTASKENKSDKPKGDKEQRCFVCGSGEHLARNCPNKDDGPKCFNCNKFGHIAAKCDGRGKTKDDNARSVNVVTRSATDDEIIVQVNDVKIRAMIDTGTDHTLLRQSEYEKIGSPPLRETSDTFEGFGSARIKAVGVFRTTIRLYGDEYNGEVHVVPNCAMNHAMLVGKKFTRQMEVVIRGGLITIKKLLTNKTRIDKEERGKEKEEDEKTDDDVFCELRFVNLIERSVIDVDDRYRKEIEKVIEGHVPKKEVVTDVETKIVLQDETPVCMRPRRLAAKEKTILDKQVDEWLKEGVIQPSKSKYSSPVVIVPKKNGEYRVCVDYRQLNKKIARDRFPMPLIDDRIDALADARVFSVLDLKNGFFHVPVEVESRKYTSFVTPDGQYEFVKTPFGLCNSPTSFLRFIDEVFRNLIRRNIVFTYVDDLIIPGRNEEEALANLKETLAVAAERGLSINWKKCAFLKRRVEYLGHVIEGGTVGPSPSKIKAVKNFPKPTTKKAVQSFLGLTGYFRKFVRDYSKIARPLSELLKTNQRFRFEEKEEQSFEQLKQLLTSEPILRIYRPDAVTELHTDASKEGYGAALLQKGEEDDRFHVVYYTSRKTSDAEKRLHSYELEALAVIQAVKKFRVYLLGIKFTLVTDCSAFQKTLSKIDISPKVARWALMLEEFEYEVEHRAGTRLKHVDALSRYPVMIVEDKITPMIRREQDNEERLHVIKKVLETGPYEDYSCENGILMKRVDDRNVVVLPTSMQQEVIRKAHDNGHFGVKKMLESIKAEYYIPNLKEKLERYVSCCIRCILAEGKRGKKEGELKTIPKGDTPLATYHIDHLGPMTTTSKAYKYLFVVVDGFSKFVWIYPTKSTKTNEVLDRLKNQQKTFGNPRRIVSDRGAAFTSADFREYCIDENIEHVLITTGVPRGNGQVERINRIIIPILTKLAHANPDRWYRYVDKVQCAINSTYQRSVGLSPFEVLFGVKMRQRHDAEVLALIEKEAILQFDEEREALRVLAKDNIAKIQQENRRTHDRRCKPSTKYHVGDLVAIKRTQFGPGSKLRDQFLGPYKITRVKGNDRYEMARQTEGEGPQITTSSADQMKPFKMYSPGTGETQEWPNVGRGPRAGSDATKTLDGSGEETDHSHT